MFLLKLTRLLFCDMLLKVVKAQVQAVRSFTGSETQKVKTWRRGALKVFSSGEIRNYMTTKYTKNILTKKIFEVEECCFYLKNS